MMSPERVYVRQSVSGSTTHRQPTGLLDQLDRRAGRAECQAEFAGWKCANEVHRKDVASSGVFHTHGVDWSGLDVIRVECTKVRCRHAQSITAARRIERVAPRQRVSPPPYRRRRAPIAAPT